MTIRSERFEFQGATGEALAARLELPEGAIRSYALFAHCFTCGKDSVAATRVSRALASLGIATLRFDFTGLGSSAGDFSNTNFSSNVGDLVHASDHLRQHHQAPTLLVGHSLGGAAVLVGAAQIPEVRAVVTIGAPATAEHVFGLVPHARRRLASETAVEVQLGERRFSVTRQFLEDVSEQRVLDCVGELGRALLVCHAPLDDVVGIDNASRIFLAAKHPKSFVSLDDANHLLTRRADAEYLARLVAAWASRYVGEAPEESPASESPMTRRALEPRDVDHPDGVSVRSLATARFAQEVTVGRHRLQIDEPAAVGGDDLGPGPYDLLLAALGACTSMTLRLYAERKGIDLEGVEVTLRHERIHAKDCEDCEQREGRIDVIDRAISLSGPLSDDARRRLLEIANKCPVHRTLTSSVHVRDRSPNE